MQWPWPRRPRRATGTRALFKPRPAFGKRRCHSRACSSGRRPFLPRSFPPSYQPLNRRCVVYVARGAWEPGPSSPTPVSPCCLFLARPRELLERLLNLRHGRVVVFAEGGRVGGSGRVGGGASRWVVRASRMDGGCICRRWRPRLTRAGPDLHCVAAGDRGIDSDLTVGEVRGSWWWATSSSSSSSSLPLCSVQVAMVVDSGGSGGGCGHGGGGGRERSVPLWDTPVFADPSQSLQGTCRAPRFWPR